VQFPSAPLVAAPPSPAVASNVEISSAAIAPAMTPAAAARVAPAVSPPTPTATPPAAPPEGNMPERQ
jgi:hypothetical protein